MCSPLLKSLKDIIMYTLLNVTINRKGSNLEIIAVDMK
jgi:hypothetical protein